MTKGRNILTGIRGPAPCKPFSFCSSQNVIYIFVSDLNETFEHNLAIFDGPQKCQQTRFFTSTLFIFN